MNEHEQIDRRKALQWLEGDERMFAKIKAIFIKNIPTQVELLKGFLDSGDIGSIERAAHTIMGSSAMLGAGDMSDKARSIEQSAIGGDLDSARLHFTKFVEEYEKVMLELATDGGEDERTGC
ncbi:MAG: Hpt domain-containing protein [Desulfuromonadaceae bacterium]|nr:Hpt domain-containing protein [Desulfuromonadaceae bacterium]